MPSKYEKIIYGMPSREPVIPDEIANMLGVLHRTAKDVPMHLIITKPEMRCKNLGRIHLFRISEED